MSADGALEDAIRACLLADAGVLALVPAAHLMFRQGTRTPSPSIISGPSHALPMGQDNMGKTRVQVFQQWDVWKAEPSLHGVKEIMGAMVEALRVARPQLVGPWVFSDLNLGSQRSWFDPDGKHARGMVNLSAYVSRAAP
jgi:hypothetical protein